MDVKFKLSVKSIPYKADNFIKRTPFYGPNGVHFREIPLYLVNIQTQTGVNLSYSRKLSSRKSKESMP